MQVNTSTSVLKCTRQSMVRRRPMESPTPTSHSPSPRPELLLSRLPSTSMSQSLSLRPGTLLGMRTSSRRMPTSSRAALAFSVVKNVNAVPFIPARCRNASVKSGEKKRRVDPLLYDQYDGYSPRNCSGNRSSERTVSAAKKRVGVRALTMT